jgi:hypothetical protein
MSNYQSPPNPNPNFQNPANFQISYYFNYVILDFRKLVIVCFNYVILDFRKLVIVLIM